MDVEKACAKALFYDFPVQTVIDNLILNDRGDRQNWFEEVLCQRLHAQESALSWPVTNSTIDMLKTEWINKPNPSSIKEWVGGSFKMLKVCADKLLANINGKIKVKHEEILRWEGISRMVGQDLIVCIYKANQSGAVNSFAWEDTLPSCGKLADELDKMAYWDIHTHLGGASAPSLMNWLSVMNGAFLNDEMFDTMKTKPSADAVRRGYPPMRVWCVVAARIRYELYQRLMENNAQTFGEGFRDDLKTILSEDAFLKARLSLNTLVGLARGTAKKTTDYKSVDYAIRENYRDSEAASPYMLRSGERRIIYLFFKLYRQGTEEVKTMARYMYLYCIIKSLFRRELMMSQAHAGLWSFQQADNNKHSFLSDYQKELLLRYSFQTGMRKDSEDGVEFRISAGENEVYAVKKGRLNKCIFSTQDWYGKNQMANSSFVIHFSKARFGLVAGDPKNRRECVQHVLYEFLMDKNRLFTGIDAAGTEINYRPERLGLYYRYLGNCGHKNFTFHVGEDFYDIVDGLRAVDETMVFLGVKKGWRLGHCVAMGINAKDFYLRKNHVVVIPKQTMLDNMVWMLEKAKEKRIRVSSNLSNQLKQEIRRLFSELNINEQTSVASYYHSIWLRSNLYGSLESIGKDKVAWESAMKCKHSRSIEAEKDAEAVVILNNAYRKENNRQRGLLAMQWKVTKDYERLVRKLQQQMTKEVKRVGVSIECNPTSNLMICMLERYDKEPFFKFRQRKWWEQNGLAVTVNTDDRGTLETSLPNEFALLACSMQKQTGIFGRSKWNDTAIKNLLAKTAQEGKNRRFKWEQNLYETKR